jgi:hypothetical protein
VYNVLLRGHICHALCVAFSNSFVSVVGAQILRAQYSLSGIEWSGVSPGAKHLIRSLMTLRADQRYTVQQALRHPWLHGIPYAPTPGMGAGGEKLNVPPSLQPASPGSQGVVARVSIEADEHGPPTDRGTNANTAEVTTTESNTSAASTSASAGAAVPPRTKSAASAPAKKRQATMTGGNAGLSRQTSSAKRANLRRGGSLFAPLELKFKSSMEYVTTSTALDARAASLTGASAVVAGTGRPAGTVATSVSVTGGVAGQSKGALASALSVARVPQIAPIFAKAGDAVYNNSTASRATPGKPPTGRTSVVSAPSVRNMSTEKPPVNATSVASQGQVALTTSTPVGTPHAGAQCTTGQSISAYTSNTSSATQSTSTPRTPRTPSSPRAAIDLDHCSHTSCISSTSPHPCIVHLTVTNAVSCLDGLLVPLVQYCDRLASSRASTPSAVLPTPPVSGNNAGSTAGSGTKASAQSANGCGSAGKKGGMPGPPSFKRAMSFDDSTVYYNDAGGGGKSNSSAAGLASGLSVLLHPLALQQPRRPKPVASTTTDCEGATDGSIDPYDDAIEDYSSDDGVNAMDTRDASNKRDTVKHRRHDQKTTKKGAENKTAPTVTGLENPAAATPTVGCLKKSGGTDTPISSTGARGSGSEDASSYSADCTRPRKHRRSVSFSDDLCVLDADTVGRDDAPGEPAAMAARADGNIYVGAAHTDRLQASAAAAVSGGISLSAPPLVATTTTVSHIPDASLAVCATEGPVNAPAETAESNNEPSTGKKSAGIKRTQSSLEQAWKKASTGAVPATRQNENVLNGSSDGVGADLQGLAFPLPAAKKLRAPMKSLTELFKAAPNR